MTISTVVDIETTGLPDNPDAEIIEFGAYDLSEDCPDFQSIHFLIKPEKSIPPELSAVHHIIDDDVKDELSLSEYSEMFFDSDPDYIVAHNAAFERHFLEKFAPKKAQWICTYKCALTVWPNAPSHSNQALRYWLNLPVDREKAQPPHRALPDAYVTTHLFLELLKHKYIEDLVEITANPILLPKIKFGKHKDSKFCDLSRDYLSWLARQSDMDEDVIHTAKYWLEK